MPVESEPNGAKINGSQDYNNNKRLINTIDKLVYLGNFDKEIQIEHKSVKYSLFKF